MPEHAPRDTTAAEVIVVEGEGVRAARCFPLDHLPPPPPAAAGTEKVVSFTASNEASRGHHRETPFFRALAGKKRADGNARRSIAIRLTLEHRR